MEQQAATRDEDGGEDVVAAYASILKKDPEKEADLGPALEANKWRTNSKGVNKLRCKQESKDALLAEYYA